MADNATIEGSGVSAALMSEIADLISANPDRHDQGHWIDTAEPWEGEERWAAVEELRAFAGQPVPEQARDADRPICTTTACVAGWVAVQTAPAGTRIRFDGNGGERLWLPDGSVQRIEDYAAAQLGLNAGQRLYLFASDRQRDEVLAALAYLPQHPDATQQDLIVACGAAADDEDYADDAA